MVEAKMEREEISTSEIGPEFSIDFRQELTRLRPHAHAAICPLIMAKPTLNLRCPLSQKIGLHAKAQPAWFDRSNWSHVDPEQTHMKNLCYQFIQRWERGDC